MKTRWLVLPVLIGPALLSGTARACATCFGRSDSALAQGMNMGILFLLGVVLSVLAALTVFFIHLGRRSARSGESPVAVSAKSLCPRPPE
jgi:hypothetical protein